MFQVFSQIETLFTPQSRVKKMHPVRAWRDAQKGTYVSLGRIWLFASLSTLALSRNTTSLKETAGQKLRGRVAWSPSGFSTTYHTYSPSAFLPWFLPCHNAAQDSRAKAWRPKVPLYRFLPRTQLRDVGVVWSLPPRRFSGFICSNGLGPYNTKFLSHVAPPILKWPDIIYG